MKLKTPYFDGLVYGTLSTLLIFLMDALLVARMTGGLEIDWYVVFAPAWVPLVVYGTAVLLAIAFFVFVIVTEDETLTSYAPEDPGLRQRGRSVVAVPSLRTDSVGVFKPREIVTANAWKTFPLSLSGSRAVIRRGRGIRADEAARERSR